jgi:hypothetical protein
MRRRTEFQERMLAWDMSEIYENEIYENEIYENEIYENEIMKMSL